MDLQRVVTSSSSTLLEKPPLRSRIYRFPSRDAQAEGGEELPAAWPQHSDGGIPRTGQ